MLFDFVTAAEKYSQVNVSLSPTNKSPKGERILRINPSTMSRKDNEKKTLRESTTLSMKMRSAAVYATVHPPTIIRDYFPSVNSHDKHSLNTSAVASLSPVSGITSTTGPDIITMKTKMKEYYKHLNSQHDLSTRLSGCRDSMSTEILNYQTYPDHNKMNYPSTICVKCSISHASLCMECGELQVNEAVQLYRISRSEGAMAFFNRAIISSGQKSNTKYIIFQMWKNYVNGLPIVRNHKYVMTGMRNRRSLLRRILMQWKQFISECKISSLKKNIETYARKIVEVDGYLRGVKATKEMNEEKVSQR